MDEVQRLFTGLTSDKGLSLSAQQLVQYETYFKLLVEWNEKMNLTGITEREQVYVKHFYDSLTLSFYVDLKNTQSLADIGSGAGFPSIPLKIAYPHLKVTIIDSLQKRISFLEHVSSSLGLTNVYCVHGRAEDAGVKPELRDQFDLVTARAVAKLNILNELCLPFTKTGGLFVAMKGSDPTAEIDEAKRSLKELNGKLVTVDSLTLPVEQSERHLIQIQKTAPTPKKYPRKAGVPAKTPIL
ncbi:16S rRNA (guanine(527)-N(7))-methyltransferase RsmG [Paenibacillus turpanensis]|uniref:16S rRNA (guanine(527)-N(7))-methyltransferase RsmG n=1 Tax=Paenibacillus turpanensis TaxID=2689078 RepID=UPI00140E328F|nr:16S rRNA (guanine(527)-N(7))-methyltransferase RsmG [Paenibacillus turpanensis]